MRLRTLRFLILFLAASAAFLGTASSVHAQRGRLGRDYYEDPQHGFRFRYPEDWLIVPVQVTEQDLGEGAGKIAQLEGPAISTRIGSNQSVPTPVRLDVFRMKAGVAVTRDEEEGAGGLRDRLQKTSSRTTIEQLLQRNRSLRDFSSSEPRERKARRLPMLHQQFRAFTGDYDALWDTYTYHLEDYDIILCFFIAEEHYKDWQKVFYGAAKSFEEIERVRPVTLGPDPSYEEILAYERYQASLTPGWKVYPTPSQRYVIVSSSDDEDFIEEVIERLENSRDLFERDFPPEKPIEHVSRVRICATAEEFHKYGKTGGGVLGWFNPGTTELVLFDAKNYDRNISFGVMTHEGFHQYCHFLFNQSEAHRWFDEGHGDYYGAFEFKRGKAISRARMRGIDRLQEVRQMIREGRIVPIAEHVQMDHPTWQRSYGYPQSWSIVYMLRQGMEGKVPRKLWREEYADIIPNYMRVLSEEYTKAWEELREEVRRRKEAAGEELKPEDLEIPNLKRFLSREHKQEIWDRAFAASWGQIDIEEFETNWLEYVSKHIRN